MDNENLITVKQFDILNLSLTKLAAISRSKVDVRILMHSSPPQRAAKSDIKERWILTETRSAEFVRRVDLDLTYFPHIEATSKNKALFVKSSVDALDMITSKITSIKYSEVNSAVVRFDGEINNKTGVFLIEFPFESIREYVDFVKAMKAIKVGEKLSLSHLLNFYADKPSNPFTQFNIEKFRYIYLPIN
ncbi:hypothetical protein [Solibacillus sp. FSL K6-1126]|uniref:hypothetical protein n=1 Tax=Solibacillus sp. FSL K6-1126 TaxID=2921463 RepID=UPI0030F67F9B